MSALPKDWHNHEGYRAVFNAALSGICANPAFFGPIYQGEPASAVAFAKDVLRAALADGEGRVPSSTNEVSQALGTSPLPPEPQEGGE